MNRSDTPPEKRLRRLCASRRSRWSRYLAVSPIHNLRTTPPSGRISFIGSPDIIVIVDKTRLESASSLKAHEPESTRAQRINRALGESQHDVGPWPQIGKAKD